MQIRKGLVLLFIFLLIAIMYLALSIWSIFGLAIVGIGILLYIKIFLTF